MRDRVREMLRSGVTRLGRLAARSYVAGPALSDAVSVCVRLSRSGIAGTICLWNADGQDPRTIADQGFAAMGAIANGRLDARLSIRAPALRYDLDLVQELVALGRHTGIGIQFDSHAPESADPTFSVIAACAKSAAGMGCTLPGRWRRSVSDAEWAVELGLNARVVKGRWAAPGAQDRDLCEGFLAVIDRLAGRARHVSVATHDTALAREALRRLLPGTPCELELLFGLPMKAAARIARDANVPLRVYVPYGQGSLPYPVSRVQQEPRLAFRMARDLLLGRHFRLMS